MFQLRVANCDSTAIRLRYDDITLHSTMTKVVKITICIRFDCDTTTIRLGRKIDVHFLLVSNEAGAHDMS